MATAPCWLLNVRSLALFDTRVRRCSRSVCSWWLNHAHGAHQTGLLANPMNALCLTHASCTDAGKLLLRALDAFWYNVEDGKRVQGAVETMARSSTLRRFFASWRDLTASSTEHRDIAVSLLTARRTRAALANSFDEWRSRAVHSHDLAILLEHASGLRLKRTLLRCMAAWAFHAANKQRRKAILADVAPKRQKAQLAACLRAWRAVVDDTKVDMVSVRLAVVRRARHVVTVWRSRCATSRRVAAFTARRSKATLQAAFALWQSSVQLTRARNAAVSALVTYTASRRLAAAFRAWRSVTDVDFMLRASVFAAWRSCTAISRAAEIQHAEALRDAVNATEKSAADAHDLIVNTLTNVATQQVALQSAAAKAATREAAAKCMASVRQRAHRRAVFDAWQAECARAERCRVALDTRLAVLRRRALVAAFAEWRHWVAYKKRKRCLAARAQGVAEASQARGLKAIFLAWWRLAHAHQAPRAARAAAAEALAARSRRATLRWALTRWLSGAVEQQRKMRKEARAMSHWQTRTLRACIFSWALHVSSQQAVLRRVAAMAARDAIASQRQALRAWKDYVASLKAARAAQQIDMLQAELARLQARYGRLVGAALEDPGAAVLRAAASTPAADMLSYVRTPALSVVHSRVGGVAAVMT